MCWEFGYGQLFVHSYMTAVQRQRPTRPVWTMGGNAGSELAPVGGCKLRGPHGGPPPCPFLRNLKVRPGSRYQDGLRRSDLSLQPVEWGGSLPWGLTLPPQAASEVITLQPVWPRGFTATVYRHRNEAWFTPPPPKMFIDASAPWNCFILITITLKKIEINLLDIKNILKGISKTLCTSAAHTWRKQSFV